MNVVLAAVVAALAVLLAEPPAERPAPRTPPRLTRVDSDPAVRALLHLIWGVCNADAPQAVTMPAAADAWLEQHRPALIGVKPAPLAEQPWGLAATRPGGEGNPTLTYLYVFDWHASGKMIIYGLTGGVRKAYLFGDAKQSALPVSRLNNSIVIAGPKDAPDPLVSVIVLESADKLETVATVVRPADDGGILLHARDAVVHGRTVRYEPEPKKNTVGYWTDGRDWVSWEFEVTKPGTYRVEILQGCGKGSGGSKVEFALGGQVLPVTVQDTGGFQNFVARDIGPVRFDKPGRYVLTVTPKEKQGVAVMDLRQVTLTPVKD
jgi:hypothetical protein